MQVLVCFFRLMLLPMALLSALIAGSAMAAEDFALLDEQGRFHQLSRYGERPAVVLFVYQNADTAAQAAVPVLQALRDQYAADGIIFLLLNPTDSPQDVQAEVAARSIGLPVLIDEAQLVARSLEAERSAEVIVLDPAGFDVLYRGALHAEGADGTGSVHMQQVLDAVLADQEVPAGAAAAGMSISYRGPLRADAPAISYQHEIVPLLRRNCTVCHVEGGLAPWAMSSYIMVLGWSPMIRETIITKRMPPGQIDMQVGHWSNPPHISLEDQALLLAWIDAGAPRDGDQDPLAEPVPAVPVWSLGEPDMIVDVPEQAIPATGTVDFLLSQAALDLDEDRWLRAVAYEPGDRSVLHSLMVYARDEDAAAEPPESLIDARSDFISLYVPGEQADVFAEDSGFLLQKNKDLAFKIRYITSGRETIDRTRIGLYFHDSPPELALQSLVLSNRELLIPAGAGNHRETASVMVADEALLDMISPHAHGRAVSMRISAMSPAGGENQLINIASYNFNWQMAYRPEQRIRIPAGTRLLAETVYDNSLANPYNPDPGQQARWGVSDSAEMFSHFVRIARPAVSP